VSYFRETLSARPAMSTDKQGQDDLNVMPELHDPRSQTSSGVGPLVSQKARFAVIMLLVGAVTSVCLAIVSWAIDVTFSNSATPGLVYFIAAQAPIALTVLLSVAAVLLVESFFTKTPSGLLDGLLKCAVFAVFAALLIYYVINVASNTFTLYASLQEAGTTQSVQQRGTALPALVQLAASNAANRPTEWWSVAFTSFILLCIYRAALTVYSTRNLIESITGPQLPLRSV
jgi:hypothetical protein